MDLGTSAAPDYDPKGRARRDLSIHVLEKGFQAGSVLGTASLVPYAAFRHFRPRPGQDTSIGHLTERGLQISARSAIWGIPLAAAFGLAVIYGRSVDEEGIEDRAYRLNYNESQNRTDSFARTGALLGAMVGSAMGTSIVNAVGGAAVGTAIGIFAHVATYKDAEQGPNGMLAEVASSSK